ncbi:MAG: hypothetical protein Q8M98_09110 [Candidatus Cloacimonadaceae bacterium]|nr:hypothetical protein [Candidatus Cloacimonadaceae bacterium]MDP3114923.1 hypothetical protein [Candidatus Cloacimonadaceae bacterium]
MKKSIILAVALILTFAAFSCKRKTDKKALPDAGMAHEIAAYAPLPTFREVFRTLDQLPVKDISASLPTNPFKTIQEEGRNAFALGLLTADAILASHSRNKTKLREYSQEMMKLTPLLKLEGEIDQLGNKLRILIERDQWEEIDGTLDLIRKEVENKLWDTENKENYTLMLLGGWTEGVNRIAWIINSDFIDAKTQVLNHKDTWKYLIGNLEMIQSPRIKEAPYFVQVMPLIKDIQAVINADNGGIYSKDQLGKLIAATDNIKAAFSK